MRTETFCRLRWRNSKEQNKKNRSDEKRGNHQAKKKHLLTPRRDKPHTKHKPQQKTAPRIKTRRGEERRGWGFVFSGFRLQARGMCASINFGSGGGHVTGLAPQDVRRGDAEQDVAPDFSVVPARSRSGFSLFLGRTRLAMIHPPAWARVERFRGESWRVQLIGFPQPPEYPNAHMLCVACRSPQTETRLTQTQAKEPHASYKHKNCARATRPSPSILPCSPGNKGIDLETKQKLP